MDEKTMDEKTINERLKFYAGKDIEIYITKKNRVCLKVYILAEESKGIYIIIHKSFGKMHISSKEILYIKTLNDVLDSYIGKGIEVHIIKKDRMWLNSYILSKESEEEYIINERKLGIMHIFSKDIFDISECRGTV